MEIVFLVRSQLEVQVYIFLLPLLSRSGTPFLQPGSIQSSPLDVSLSQDMAAIGFSTPSTSLTSSLTICSGSMFVFILRMIRAGFPATR